MFDELKLLAGDPIQVGNVCKVHPLKLREIKDIGEDVYNQNLFFITLNKEKLKDNEIFNQEILTQLSDYELFILLYVQDPYFQQSITHFFNLIFKEPQISLHQEGFFYLGDISEKRWITEDIFNQITQIIKKQNLLQEEEKQFRPANDKARELIEKRKKIMQKLQKQNKQDGLKLSDIVSIVSSYSPDINILNVWDLTVYQLYNAYIRLLVKDSFEREFAQYLQGADPQKLNLKHWASKINL
jgi:hypothetical protein